MRIATWKLVAYPMTIQFETRRQFVVVDGRVRSESSAFDVCLVMALELGDGIDAGKRQAHCMRPFVAPSVWWALASVS